LGRPGLLGNVGLSLRTLALRRTSRAIAQSVFFIYKVLFKFVQIITGIELPCEVVVGRNFVIDHFGGIVISGYAQFGDDCRIRNGVVVGLKNVNDRLPRCSATMSTSAPVPRCWAIYALATMW
jgi:serine O-acetyltransferase